MSEVHENTAEPQTIKVVDLRPDAKDFNITIKVVEVTAEAERPSRFGGRPQKVAECLVGDETACVVLTARNEQVEAVRGKGYITLKRARVEMARGNMRLAVGRSSSISEASGETFKVKSDFNMSHLEFELIPIPPPSKAGEATAASADEEGKGPATPGDHESPAAEGSADEEESATTEA